VNFTSSIPVDGLLPLPVDEFNATILIQIGWLILFKELPKFTVTVVFENIPLVIIKLAGLVVMVEKAPGLSPTP